MEIIDQLYRQAHGVTLKEYCDKEMGGNLSKFLKYLQMDEAEFDSYILRKAMEGFGTNEGMIIETVCSRSYTRLSAARSNN